MRCWRVRKRAIKRAVLEGADLSLPAGLALERQVFAQLFDTKDQKEDMNAFLEKRPPVYKNR